MKLRQLTATNFMPYRNKITVDFPVDDNCNVMLVFGDNMRGKTSLLNALRWGFYGKALGRHSRPIIFPDIVNLDGARVDDWKVDVFLKFEANGHEYELRRTADRKPHVTTPTRPDDFIVATHLSRDGVVIAGDQVDAEINQIAPEQVARFFLFDGELLGEYEELLIQGSEQGRQIKEAIEKVLGVPALTNGRAELGALLKSATKKQGQELAHIQGLQGAAANMESLSTRLDSEEKDHEGLQKLLIDTRDERTVLDDELEQAASTLAQKAALDAARGTVKDQESILKQKRTDRHNLLAIAWKDILEAKLDVKRTLLTERQSKASKKWEEKILLHQKIKNLQAAIDVRVCPTCEQPFPEEMRAAQGAELGLLEARYSELERETENFNAISSELSGLDQIRGANVRDRLSEVEKDIRVAEVTLQRAENDIERISEQIAGQDTAALGRKRIRQNELLKEEGRLIQEIKTAQAKVELTKSALAVARRSMEGLAGSRSQRSTIKAAILQKLEECFNVSVERLRDRLREEVEKTASASFKEMTTQKSYQGLEINENYGLSILDSSGRKVSVRSAGAEQVVALSLIDGLNRTGRAIGPVVMDTPFGRLDPKHRDNILRHLPAVTTQFVLLVHTGEIRPETDLASIKSKIGASYTIQEVSETQSTIERTAL